jgi:hypothetical protein
MVSRDGNKDHLDLERFRVVLLVEPILKRHTELVIGAVIPAAALDHEQRLPKQSVVRTRAAASTCPASGN